MSKQKKAYVVDNEALTRAKRMILSREEAKEFINALFHNAKSIRRVERAKMELLLEQAPAAEVQSPYLAKESAAKNVTEFFEKKAYLTDAQKRFPELLKVAGDGSASEELKKVSKKPGQATGATPKPSVLNGGV